MIVDETSNIEELPIIIRLHKWPPYKVTEDIHIVSSFGYSIVPKGYKTDFLSLPAIIRPFLERVDETAIAALAHDLEYTLQERNRKDIDQLFYEIMIYCRTNEKKAWCIWFSVRCFGWFVWYKKQLYRWLRSNGWMKHNE